MAFIDDIIRREVNPFDPTTFKPGNFWREKQDSALTVKSIHQEAIAEIEALLDQVAKDHRSRTVLLSGESGSGKSYLLGRLKITLNPKAFFAYIGPWPDSDHIRRHILRYTVDSLMHVPESQQDSQLMLWLKSLSAFKQRSLKERILKDSVWDFLCSDRQKFIKHLKATYKQAAIYNADIFFGVLHDLTDPELYPLACEWLRGDDLSEESLQALKIKRSIDTEDSAWETLSNLGRISTETQPIVLCFDNLDNIPRLRDGLQDLQPLFNVNTTIHNDSLKNFLVLISLITNYWKQNSERIQQSDQARIDQKLHLKNITLDQTEALWASRLKPLHLQANPQPNSPIFPLTRQALEENFPGGRTDPRNALILGRQIFQNYKKSLGIGQTVIDPNTQQISEFQLIWQDEYNKVKAKMTKITLLAAPELIRMLQEALAAIQMQEIKPKLLSGKFSSYSLSYQQAVQRKRIGVVWTEDPNMQSFFNVMNACHKAISGNLCQTLHLIRAAAVGDQKLVGNQIYRQIFTGTHHCHIKPNLSSVHYLATYHSLVNAALANELVVAGKTLNLKELEALIRESKILHKCTLLQNLGIVHSQNNGRDNDNGEDKLQDIKECLLNLIKTQQVMGLTTLIQNIHSQFSQVNVSEIEQIIYQLCQANIIKILNPKEKPEAQLVCLIPKD